MAWRGPIIPEMPGFGMQVAHYLKNDAVVFYVVGARVDCVLSVSL